ncbi:MAG: hypothetical protein PHU46_13000 [Rhodocyclaceae bacterium]|nr:hypothetical protein [Rhodocyclaceae bacterium]
MHRVRILGLVLHGFYRRRQGGYVTPRLGDFGHCLTFEDIFPACELLARHELLEWKVIWGAGSASFGTGRISPLGIEVMEGRVRSPLPMLLPHPAAGGTQCGSTVSTDIAHYLHGISSALDCCEAGSADLAEARRRLRELAEHPLVSAMASAPGSPQEPRL